MTVFKLLDADLIINIIRTFSLVNEEQRENILDSIKIDNHFQFVTTKEVKSEVNQRLLKKKSNNETDEFFSNKKDTIKQIERRLFKKIRILSIEKNCALTVLISSTNLRNLGEKSLVGLLLCKYHKLLTDHQDSVFIVSNNHKDIQPIYRKAVQLYQQNTQLPKELSNLQSIPEFYIELLKHLRIDKEVIIFFLYISNIDTKTCDSKVIEIFRDLS